MSEREPLGDWLLRTYKQPAPDKREQARLRQDLDQLEAWLDASAEGRPRAIPHVRGSWYAMGQLAPHDLPRVQQLYRRVVATSGSGKSHVEEELLSLIAGMFASSAIPFFVELLDLVVPRDKLAAQRRQLALAALALLAYRRDDADALAALLEATRHDQSQVRTLAVYYVRTIFFGYADLVLIDDDEPPAMAEDDELPRPRRAIPPQVIERMDEIATRDPAFESRFMARTFLDAAGQPVPLDRPDNIYAFKVAFMYAKQIYRVIELRSEQTLEDLHLAIQGAIGWDNDHLYSFFMNGRKWDERYRFASPLEEDAPAWTNEAVIGALGLTLKHKFLYYFDYGDSHEFEVEVVGIGAQAAPGSYPRVVESQGKAPAQYEYSEADDYDDDDYDDDELADNDA